MFKQLPSSIQGSAKALMDGQLTAKQWNETIKQLPATQQKMAEQFAHVVDGSQQFNKQLASGSPAAQTYNAALSKMLGGATGLNTALMLTGSRMDTFSESANAIAE